MIFKFFGMPGMIGVTSYYFTRGKVQIQCSTSGLLCENDNFFFLGVRLNAERSMVCKA